VSPGFEALVVVLLAFVGLGLGLVRALVNAGYCLLVINLIEIFILRHIIYLMQEVIIDILGRGLELRIWAVLVLGGLGVEVEVYGLEINRLNIAMIIWN